MNYKLDTELQINYKTYKNNSVVYFSISIPFSSICPLITSYPFNY